MNGSNRNDKYKNDLDYKSTHLEGSATPMSDYFEWLLSSYEP